MTRRYRGKRSREPPAPPEPVICAHCNKHSYPTRLDALNTAMIRIFRGRVRTLRIYECPAGDPPGFHLTKRPAKRKPPGGRPG